MNQRGSTYVPKYDQVRLGRQLRKVWHVMLDGEWRTLRQISRLTGAPEASASARLRDLRKCGWQVDRKRKGDPRIGVFVYRVSYL
jgi:DNA-binding IclR family transcriptional regulator